MQCHYILKWHFFEINILFNFLFGRKSHDAMYTFYQHDFNLAFACSKTTVVFEKPTGIEYSYKIYTSFSYASSTNKFLPSAAAVANSSQRLFNGLLAWPFTQTKLTVNFFASSW